MLAARLKQRKSITMGSILPFPIQISDHSFDAEITAIMCRAYEVTCNELHDKGQPEIVKEIIAKRIIELAGWGERERIDCPADARASRHGRVLSEYGNIAESLKHWDRALALYKQEREPLGVAGIDSKVSALSWRSLALWFLGYPEAAEEKLSV
jgi:hypothetical protein